MLGKNREQAFWRLVALLWQATAGYVLTIGFSILGFGFAVVDLLLQSIFNWDGLSEDGWIGSMIESFWDWTLGQTVFFLTGGGDKRFRWLPDF